MPSALQQPGLVLRLAAALAALVVLAVPYPLLNAALPPRFDLVTPLDRAVPFLPWTLSVYACWLALPGLAVALSRGREFHLLLLSLAGCALCCYLGFALFTAHLPHPAPESIPARWRAGYAFLARLDGPGNTFPSLHVAITVATALRMRRKAWGWAWLAAAALVALSTLTTRQHVVADLAGGVAVAALVEWAVSRRGSAGP